MRPQSESFHSHVPREPFRLRGRDSWREAVARVHKRATTTASTVTLRAPDPKALFRVRGRG